MGFFVQNTGRINNGEQFSAICIARKLKEGRKNFLPFLCVMRLRYIFSFNQSLPSFQLLEQVFLRGTPH